MSLQFLLEKFGIQKENQKKFFAILLIVLAGAVIVPKLLHVLGISVNAISLLLLLVVLCVLMAFTLSIAALAIFRSLFVVGAGLSLIIFLAQEYCKLDSNLRTSNVAVGYLVEIGMLYVAILFLICLYKELFGDMEAKSQRRQKGIFKMLKEANEGEHSLIILLPFTLFFGTLLGQLVQVIILIVSNLCVF